MFLDVDCSICGVARKVFTSAVDEWMSLQFSWLGRSFLESDPWGL